MYPHLINAPFPVFTGADGTPLEAGYIYIGSANQNPETNPVSVYWDSALTIPAAQPIRTVGGYPSRNGAPARIYVDGDYSVTVRDKQQRFVFSAMSAIGAASADAVAFTQTGTGAVARTVQSKLEEYPSNKDFGAAGGGETDDAAALTVGLAATPKKATFDCGLSRISVTAGKPSFDSNLAAFNSITWPDNVAARYKGPTEENVYYSNFISKPYGSYPNGVPVNESIFAAPYHPAIAIDVKTPASFNGVQQTAHIIGAAIGSTTIDATSLVFRKDGASEYTVGVRTSAPGTIYAARRAYSYAEESGTKAILSTDLTLGYTSVNCEKTVMNHPFEVGGELNIVTGSFVRPDLSSFNSAPTLNLENNVTGIEGSLYVHASNPLLVLKCKAQTVGQSWLQLGTNTGYLDYPDLYYAPAASATVLRLSKNGSTGRSINVPGTVNAGGADYAEYERNDGPPIAKGDIVGFKADGTLTLRYDEAVRFGIKSTDPSYVGGDKWFNEEAPSYPEFNAPTYDGPAKPSEPDAPAADADVVTIQNYEKAAESYAFQIAEYNIAVAAYQAKWEVAKHAYSYALEAYQHQLNAFNMRLEAERKKVDRVAYAGKVPVNVLGATPGDYVLAARSDDGAITGMAVKSPDFEQYKNAVGRVNKILDDGRAEVAVIIH